MLPAEEFLSQNREQVAKERTAYLLPKNTIEHCQGAPKIMTTRQTQTTLRIEEQQL